MFLLLHLDSLHKFMKGLKFKLSRKLTAKDFFKLHDYETYLIWK